MYGVEPSSKELTLDSRGAALERVKRTKGQLEAQLADLNKLIALLEKNPEIEAILTLARRFV